MNISVQTDSTERNRSIDDSMTASLVGTFGTTKGHFFPLICHLSNEKFPTLS